MSVFKTFKEGFIGGLSTLFISSNYGWRSRGWHGGIDVKVPSGTKLYAPCDGYNAKIKWQKRAGLYFLMRVKSSDDNRFVDICFMHMHSISSKWRSGGYIYAGDYIGETGGSAGDVNRGSSTGAHCHIQINMQGSFTNNHDPKKYFLAKHKLIYKGNKVLQAKLGYERFSLAGSIPANSEMPTTTVISKSHKSTKDVSLNDNLVTDDATETFFVDKTDNSKTTTELAPGIWQIVKILIDSSVENKQVTDSSISTQTGSLLNFFRKVCQEPFVEFMGDTYKNQYYFIVRRPPFDKEGFKRMLELTRIDIDSEDILYTELKWNDDDVYSWYQYMPQNDILLERNTNLYVPAVFFPEFASLYGSKPLCIESVYYNFMFSGAYNNDKNENNNNSKRIISNVASDFKYLIESNAYNPFTRKGIIKINGDRRIKRGTLISIPSGEVFHVDSVTNEFSIEMNSVNRTTTLLVSHGIYPDYIDGKVINGKNISYFNIIDFGDFDKRKELMNFTDFNEIIQKWKVNSDSFAFFMSKQQVYWESINKSFTGNIVNGAVEIKGVTVTAKKITHGK